MNESGLQTNAASALWENGASAEKPAIVVDETVLTYGNLRSQSLAAAGLIGVAACEAPPVLLAAHPCPEYFIWYYGLMAAGHAVAPVSAISPAREWAHYLDVSKAETVVINTANLTALAEADARQQLRRVIVLDPPAPARLGELHLERLATGHERHAAQEPVLRDGSSDALVVFTGGTTGLPKGVVFSHSAVLGMSELMADLMEVSASDIMLCTVPLHHGHGEFRFNRPAIQRGATVVIVPKFSAAGVAEIVERRGATLISGPPTIYSRMLRESVPPTKLRSVTRCFSATAPLPAEVKQEFQSRFGIRIYEGYGPTETGTTFSQRLGSPDIPGTVGTALPYQEVRFKGAGGVASADSGELLVRNPFVMSRYLNNPAGTADAFEDGFFKTGDIGHLDATGNLSLVGREKLFINRAGEKVSPREVEEVLLTHPEVVEAAVYGLPDDDVGECVAAAVVLRSTGSVTHAELRSFCLAQLSYYKAPVVWKFLEKLPRSEVDKVLYTKLREQG